MKIVMKFPAPHNVGTTEYRIVYEHVVAMLEDDPTANGRNLAVGSLRELEFAAASMADTIECSPNNLTLTTTE